MTLLKFNHQTLVRRRVFSPHRLIKPVCRKTDHAKTLTYYFLHQALSVRIRHRNFWYESLPQLSNYSQQTALKFLKREARKVIPVRFEELRRCRDLIDLPTDICVRIFTSNDRTTFEGVVEIF